MFPELSIYTVDLNICDSEYDALLYFSYYNSVNTIVLFVT